MVFKGRCGHSATAMAPHGAAISTRCGTQRARALVRVAGSGRCGSRRTLCDLLPLAGLYRLLRPPCVQSHWWAACGARTSSASCSCCCTEERTGWWVAGGGAAGAGGAGWTAVCGGGGEGRRGRAGFCFFVCVWGGGGEGHGRHARGKGFEGVGKRDALMLLGLGMELGAGARVLRCVLGRQQRRERVPPAPAPDCVLPERRPAS